MNTIEIKTKNGVKEINNRNLNQTLKELDLSHLDVDLFKSIFNKITSEEELIDELKKVKDEHSTLKILMYIMYLGNLPISEANPILEKVLEE